MADAEVPPIFLPNQEGKKPLELAAVSHETSVQLDRLRQEQALNRRFLEMCAKYLQPMDVSKDPQSFQFPYIDREKDQVILADGQMGAEEINIGGNVYKINVLNRPITLTGISFPGGYGGETLMDGKIGVWKLAAPSPFPARVNTAKLYKFLDELRRGKKKGEKSILDARIPETHMDIEIEFTAL